MKHLTEGQRYSISAMLELNLSNADIAKRLGKHPSTIGRELARNQDKRSQKYIPDQAERKCQERHQNKIKHIRFTTKMKAMVERYLRDDYSPEQVKGVCRKESIPCVSVERIYQHIWADKKKGGTLYSHLRCKGRRYRKRGNSKDSRGIIKNRVSIDQRPKSVDQRKYFGDLEVDLIVGQEHKSAILTINDRASGMLKMQKVQSKDAKVVAQAMKDLLEEWQPFLSTITADNGKEFAEHEDVAEQLMIDYYFAHPYHSWERGSNENLNGLIRQYFPKSCDFRTIKNEEIIRVQNKLNNRPRKRHNYETPIFVMNQLLYNDKMLRL